MRAIMQKLVEELKAGRSCVLVTIVRDSGSSPRGKGSMMLTGEQGLLCGSVGGGKVEALALLQAADCLAERRSCAREYVLREEGAEAIGMACGGDVTMHFEYADTSCCEKFVRILSDLDDGREGIYRVDAEGFGVFDIPYTFSDRAILYGGGHIALALADLLVRLDFRVWVVDDRPAFAAVERFPTAEKVICCDYARLSDKIAFQDSDYHVVITDGHRHDFTVQEQLLRHKAAYVGCIGSRRKTAAVRDMLLASGIPEEQIGRVHGPIGLDIKAKTPAEIAVSIAAEMILERAKAREGLTEYANTGCPMMMKTNART